MKINKYLSKNPIPWLLEDSDIGIKYLTTRDILEKQSSALYNKLLSSETIKNILDVEKNKIPGQNKKFESLNNGTLWLFIESIERGLSVSTKITEETANYIVKNFQMASGGFSGSWNPKQEDAILTSIIVYYFIKSNFLNEDTNRAIEWLLKIQREDGSWFLSPLSGGLDYIKLILFNSSGKLNKKIRETSPMERIKSSILCMKTLSTYKNTLTSLNVDVENAIKKGLEFIIANNSSFFQTNKIKLGYPIFFRYDILTILDFMAELEETNNSFFTKGFNLIMSKENKDSTWNLEKIGNGMLLQNKKELHTKNKWITLRVLRLLKKLEKN